MHTAFHYLTDLFDTCGECPPNIFVSYCIDRDIAGLIIITVVIIIVIERFKVAKQ